MDTDRMLAAGVLKGNTECFGSLVKKYYRGVTAFLMKMGCSREDAEDLAQEAFIKVYDKLYMYNSHWAFSTWLYRVVLNTYKDYRKKKRIPEQLIEFSEGTPALKSKELTPEDFLDNTLMHEDIVRMFNSLKADVRTLMILRFHQGFSYREIADICRITPEAVKMKIKRARIKLGNSFTITDERGGNCEM